MNMRETVTFGRNAEAVMIPSGERVLVPQGATGTITQSLGGTFTIITDRGLMIRISGKELEAIGKADENAAEAKPVEEIEPDELEQLVWDQLKTCYDPEIPVNIVDLGLVYDCRLINKPEGGTKVEVKMTLTAPGCGMGPAIAHDAQSKILSIDGVDEADVQLVWDPPWNQNMISEAGRMKLGMI